MTGGPLQRWRERPGRTVRVTMTFPDVMEVALALLALSPAEVAALGWSFANRKRLLEHFLIAGKSADRIEPEALDEAVVTFRVPLRDIEKLRHFGAAVKYIL